MDDVFICPFCFNEFLGQVNKEKNPQFVKCPVCRRSYGLFKGKKGSFSFKYYKPKEEYVQRAQKV